MITSVAIPGALFAVGSVYLVRHALLARVPARSSALRALLPFCGR